MLLHQGRHIKHANQHRLARGYASQGSIFSHYTGLGCANSVQLLARLQQAILQPCASYACEVWAPASARTGPLRELEQLQRTFLCRACRVKKIISVDTLPYFRSYNRCVRMTSGGEGLLVPGLWLKLIQALYSMIFHDAIQLAHSGCKFSWAAQVFKLLSFGSLPFVADALIATYINLLQELFLRDMLAGFDRLPQDPRLAPSAGVKLCTHHRWFGRPQNGACPSYWGSPWWACCQIAPDPLVLYGVSSPPD